LCIIKEKILVSSRQTALLEIPILFSFIYLFFCVLFSANDLIVLYLSLEGISLVLYALGSVINESLLNIEAIVKYFIINSFASSLLLWTMGYIYGFTGSTNFDEIQYVLVNFKEDVISFGLYYIFILFFISVIIKAGLFPFH